MDTLISGNPNYLVTIRRTEPSLTIQAPMPDAFMFDSSAQYEAPFAQGWVPTDFVRNVLGAFGRRTTSQVLSLQIWQGNQDTDLGLDLEFQAERDPIREVMQPIASLLTLTTPKADSLAGLMKAPGPHLDLDKIIKLFKVKGTEGKSETAQAVLAGAAAGMVDAASSTPDGNNQSKPDQSNEASSAPTDLVKQAIKGNISIRIGNYMFFDCVVITDVQQTFTNQLDERGIPWHAKVSIRFRPAFTITQNDLNRIFLQKVVISESGNG